MAETSIASGQLFDAIGKVDQVDLLDGLGFERFLAYLFHKLNYVVQLTPASSDGGADLVIGKDGKKIAVQAKNHKSPIGVSALQEVYAAKTIYGCDEAWVVTNSVFTMPAIEMSKQLGVHLVARDELGILIREAGCALGPSPVPRSVNGNFDGLIVSDGEVIRYEGKRRAVEIPEGVTGIKDRVFETSRIEEVTLPDSLQSVGSYAFRLTNLKRLVVPSSVKSLGFRSFYGCKSLYSIDFRGHVPKDAKESFGGGTAPRESICAYEEDRGLLDAALSCASSKNVFSGSTRGVEAVFGAEPVTAGRLGAEGIGVADYLAAERMSRGRCPICGAPMAFKLLRGRVCLQCGYRMK